MLFRLPKTDDLPPGGLEKLPDRLIPFIWFFVRQIRRPLFFIVSLWAVSSVLFSSVPYFIKLFVEVFEKSHGGQDLMDHAFWPVSTFFILILIVQPVINQTGNWLNASMMPVFVNMIRRQMALYMHGHSYRYYQDDFAGRLAGKVIETPPAIRDIVGTLSGPLWYGLMTFITSTVLFATAHWIFACIALMWLVLYISVLRVIIPQLGRLSSEASEDRSVVRGRYVDTLTNILTVKIFARKALEDAYLLDSLDRTADSFMQMERKLVHLWISLNVLTGFFWGTTILTIMWSWGNSLIGTADAAMILPAMVGLTNISWWISEETSRLFQNLGTVEEGMEAIVGAHEVTDSPGAGTLTVGQGAVKYENVTFAYPARPVFENLTVDIPSGQKVGLVGPSGAGKSTFVQILLRLYDLQGGRILIDGQDIAAVTQDSVRENIAVIPQVSDLLHRSIRDNIRYGRLDATDEEIVEAAKKAHAHEFIVDLKDKNGLSGYDAKVGERGVKLSGGQRQRVAIARAILKNAPVLVLDEATSALDSESERLIQDSLFGLMQGKTVIAIAHRLSTIAHLDRLLVMDAGRIIEDGTHAELLAKGGPYARLWSMQSGGFIGKKAGSRG